MAKKKKTQNKKKTSRQKVLYEENELAREAVVFHKPPDDASIHTFKCLLEVDEY